MENTLQKQMMDTLYAADSLHGFLAALQLPYPMSFLSPALKWVPSMDPWKNSPLEELLPYLCISAEGEDGQLLYPVGECDCALDLLDDGCYAGTLCFGASIDTVISDAEEIAEAVLSAIALFGSESLPSSVQMDAYLEHSAAEGELSCLYCDADVKTRSTARLLARWKEALPVLYICRCGQGIALLCEGDVRMCPEFPAIFADMDCKSGFAGPFASPLLAIGCAEKARRAAGYAACGNVPVQFQKVRWRSFCEEALPVLEKEGYSAEDFLHEGLRRLLACDAEHDTGYFDTLYAYLFHGKSLRVAAESLQLHRNTLDYRIRRICEQFDLDLEDQNTCFELLFSCKLYHSLKKGGDA